MKRIKLPHNKYTLVDDEDYDNLNQFRWSLNSNNYVSRYGYLNGKKTFITLHRYLMNPPKGMQVDHVNGDRLNNQTFNLRVCTQSQNCTNRKASKIPNSGYRGVEKHGDRWRSRIKINQKHIHLGVFDTKEEAALAYNKAAMAYFGEYARLNNL